MKLLAAGAPLVAYTQPALRTGLMAPARRLLRISRGVILDLTAFSIISLNRTRQLNGNFLICQTLLGPSLIAKAPMGPKIANLIYPGKWLVDRRSTV